MDIQKHLSQLRRRFDELEEELSAPNLYDNPQHAQEVTREHSRVTETLKNVDVFESLKKTLREHEEIIAANEDAELVALAEEELPALSAQCAKVEQSVLTSLIPPDPNNSRNTIVEIRAGTGGDEAALFAGDLYRMYTRYAERQGWNSEVLDSSPAGLGGFKEIIFNLSGTDVYKTMKYESGVHRVQRVPVTESQGRIHTSTATVAVLPEAKEVDLEIKSDEVRIEVCRASGPGGQGVNTTDSAVQVMHIPTGMIVRCQDSRSQLKNREKALSILRARLYEKKKEEEEAKYAEKRKQQVGTGERNERIRTYNFPQNRLTDHRINYTSMSLNLLIEGDLDELFESLYTSDMTKRLSELEKE